MSFSWKEFKQKAIEIKLYRAKNQAKGQSPDYKLKHPDEARDASQGKFTLLEARVKRQMLKKQETAMNRRLKRIGK